VTLTSIHYLLMLPAIRSASPESSEPSANEGRESKGREKEKEKKKKEKKRVAPRFLSRAHDSSQFCKLELSSADQDCNGSNDWKEGREGSEKGK